MTVTVTFCEITSHSTFVLICHSFFVLLLFSRVHATLQPALSVGRSVGHTLLFLGLHFFDRTATAQMVW